MSGGDCNAAQKDRGECVAAIIREALPPGDPRHGTANGYNNLGCHCSECQIAWALYCHERAYARRVKDGVLRRRYRLAREAGYSYEEARRRQHWSDPLRG